MHIKSINLGTSSVITLLTARTLLELLGGGGGSINNSMDRNILDEPPRRIEIFPERSPTNSSEAIEPMEAVGQLVLVHVPWIREQFGQQKARIIG